jgi:phospholipid-binding lipoprotein MlaA
MKYAWFGAGLTACALSACTGMPQPHPADPWERWNRKVYAFNDSVDRAVAKPVAKAYVFTVPAPVRTGVRNFYGNFGDMWSAVNNVLQGKMLNSLQDVMRVGTNTLFGMAGLFDLATDIGLERQGKDFGQTLGYWGVKPGPYMMLPLIGPSTLRDTAALPLDRAVSPGLLVHGLGPQVALASLGFVNVRANLLPLTQLLDSVALDKYVFVRDGYLQQRRNAIFDGNPPDEIELAPPQSPASAPAS